MANYGDVNRFIYSSRYTKLVFTTQVNSTFRVRWLASSKVITQVLFSSEQPKENKMAFVGILSQINLLTSVSVKVVDIYLLATVTQ